MRRSDKHKRSVFKIELVNMSDDLLDVIQQTLSKKFWFAPTMNWSAILKTQFTTKLDIIFIAFYRLFWGAQ